MNIKWNTGRPKKDGDYAVIMASPIPYVWTLSFTTQYGWNTHYYSKDHAFPDADVLLWTEPFADEAIDKYGQG